MTDRYHNTLKPMHDQFIAPSKTYADLIIQNNNQGAIDLSEVLRYIQANA